MKSIIKITIISFLIVQIMTLTAFAFENVQNLGDMENSIYKHLENRDKNFTVVYTGERKEFEDNILNCIKSAYSKDDYLERSWLEIKPKANVTQDGIETTIDATYLTTREQEQYIDNELKNATNSLVTANMSDLKKVSVINDYIINRYQYDYTQKSISVYSALTTSLAVCQGYSMTAYKMFNYAGIENRIVVGKINDIPHSWNIVKIDGVWYQLDITNNDSTVKNRYFLVSDDIFINNKYSWDKDKYPKALHSYFN